MDTPRLLLREYRLSDSQERARLFGIGSGAEPELNWLIYHLCLYECSDGLGCLAVVLRENGCLIGEVGLEAHLSPLVRYEDGPYGHSAEVELSYRFGPTFWGNGYATESCRVLLAYAFKQLKIGRVIAETGRDNPRSLNLLRRLGAHRFVPGSPETVYAILENPGDDRSWLDNSVALS